MRAPRALLPAAVLGLAAIGCKYKVDTKDLEATLRKRTAELGMNATKVACSGGADVKPGSTLPCQVELDGKATYTLEVRITAFDEANKELQFDTAWKDGEPVQVGKLEPAITKALGEALGSPVVVECGDQPLRFLDPQRKVRCELSAGEVKTAADITFDKDLSPTDWHLEPALLARAKLEQVLTPSVRDKTGAADAKVECGSSALLVRPADGVLWCAIASGGQQAKIKVEVDDKLSVQRWELANP